MNACIIIRMVRSEKLKSLVELDPIYHLSLLGEESLCECKPKFHHAKRFLGIKRQLCYDTLSIS